MTTPPAPKERSAAREAGTSVTGRTGLIGVLVPIVYDLYFSAIMSGIAEGVYEHEMRLVLSPTQHDHAREVSLLDRLMHGATDGVLIILPEESTEELVRLQSGSCPFVVVDPLLRLDPWVPCVSAAHRSGADQAMQHLLALGHQRIAAITGPPGWVATEDRRSGYRAALSGAGIERDPVLEVDADFELGPGAVAAGRLLELPEPPTAIFAFNDSIALGAMRAARERGVRVPEDLSIVGFDDLKYATVVAPALTTVRQPLAEMGRAAVSLLLRLLGPRRPGPLQIELPTRLVVRESTGPRRQTLERT
ncbi:MAG: LacI family DNA-binding transcriptional regulator [Acidimicrobiales bacterium]